MIYIESKKRKYDRLLKEYPAADILDITSTTETKYAQLLSPFYPHGNIPIPFSPGYTAMSVEGIWQGLKVFETCGIDMASFKNDTMSGLKRTVRKYGKPLGHQKGINSNELLNYFDARMHIYLPTYLWVLDNVPSVMNIISRIKERSKENDIVFLDYNTNIDFRDISSPLSHAGLVKLYIEENYPKEGVLYTPMTDEEMRMKKESKKSKNKSSQQQLHLF